MRRIFTSALLIILISYASFAKRPVAKGESFTEMGSFKIEASDKPMVLNGVELDTYIITYENSDLSVTVAIDKAKDCKRYITLSDKLSVQYVCTERYFGIEKLTSQNSVNGVTTSDENLDRSAYFHQRVLTGGNNDNITCMKLIGAYFPELLKESEA